MVAARFSCFGVLSISLRMVKPIKRMRRRAEKGILCLQQMMLLVAATILQASLVMHAMSQGMLLVARAVAVVKIARQDEQDEQEEEEEEEHGVKGVEEAEASHVDVARTEIIHQIVDPGAAAAAAAGVAEVAAQPDVGLAREVVRKEVMPIQMRKSQHFFSVASLMMHAKKRCERTLNLVEKSSRWLS